jgi:hypothetical protein
MKPYFYIITNNINKKYYYGSGSKANYFGSSSLLRASIEKHGIENFTFTILKEFNTRSAAFAFEDRFLKLYKISKDRNSYNLKDAGQGGNTLEHNPNREEIIKQRNKKVSASLMGHSVTDEQRLAQSRSHTGWFNRLSIEEQVIYKENLSKSMKEFFSKNEHHSKGKSLSDEHKLKLSIKAKELSFGGNTMPPKDTPEYEIRIKKMSESSKGRILSDETKEKIKNSLKGRTVSDETRQKISNTLKNKKTKNE